MPDTKSSDATTESKGGPKRLIMIVAVCVVLLAAGYYIGGTMGGGAAQAEPVAGADAEPVATEVVEETVGQVIDLPAVNVNLADSHYLRVAVSLGLSHDVHYEKPDEEFAKAPAGDLVLGVFSGQSMEALATAEGRDEARARLVELIHEAYHGEVVDIYFTEFVMQ